MGKLKSVPLHWDILHHDVSRLGKTTLAEVRRLVVFYCRHRYDDLPGPEHPQFRSITVFVHRGILKDRNPPPLSHLYSAKDNGNVEVRTTRREREIREAASAQNDLVRLRTIEEAHAQIEDRRYHMLPENRKPGQDSSVSRKVYRPDMLIVTVGERDFIAANVLRFDEEVGVLSNQILRKRFQSLMYLGLPRPKREGAGFYNVVHISGVNIFPDVVDEFLGLPRDPVLSTEELLQVSPELPKRLRHR